MNVEEIFSSLKEISKYIYSLYRKLANLEYNGMKDSEEYNSILDSICFFSCLEDEMYNYASSTSKSNILEICSKAQFDMLGKINNEKLIHDSSYILSNKIKPNDIVDMRISYKSTKLSVSSLSDKSLSNLYDIYFPLRDKYFLDLLDKEIDESSDNRARLIDAKYDYAFVNCGECVKEIKDFTQEEMDEYISFSLSELFHIAEKLSKFSKKTLLNPKNRRRILLDLNNIRANGINLSDESLDGLKLYLFTNLGSDINDGFNFFVNSLELRNKDYNDINSCFSLKRKF